MPASLPVPLPPPALPRDAAVLLLLLPDGISTTTPPEPMATFAGLPALQRQLGTAVRVLVINEASHPAVVHSFHAADLPSFVLMRKGIELWRQRGLPEGDFIAPLLLSKLRAGSAAAGLTSGQ